MIFVRFARLFHQKVQAREGSERKDDSNDDRERETENRKDEALRLIQKHHKVNVLINFGF